MKAPLKISHVQSVLPYSLSPDLHLIVSDETDDDALRMWGVKTLKRLGEGKRVEVVGAAGGGGGATSRRRPVSHGSTVSPSPSFF